jgi:hypothetical protein
LKQLRTVGLETLEDALKTSALGVLATNPNIDERRSSKKASFYGHNSSLLGRRNWPEILPRRVV